MILRLWGKKCKSKYTVEEEDKTVVQFKSGHKFNTLAESNHFAPKTLAFVLVAQVSFVLEAKWLIEKVRIRIRLRMPLIVPQWGKFVSQQYKHCTSKSKCKKRNRAKSEMQFV